MKKQLVVTSTLLALASASFAAVVSDPIAHPSSAQGQVIPITVIDNGVRKDVTTDDESYDFDADNGGWSSFGTGLQNDTWHVEAVSPTHPANTDVWWSADASVGGYLSSSFVYLQTPAIDLSGADGASLSFDLYHACEAPGGEPEGYDSWDGCNVWVSTDGGSTWAVATPTSPAYNGASSFAFGSEFGMGPGIPQWTDTATGWQAASFDLSAYDGENDVRVRFVMCADPGFDYIDDNTMTGMQVDNIVVDDGSAASTVVWADDGSSNTGGAAETGFHVYGDEWMYSASGGNPDGHWVCDDAANLGCYIASPNIAITPPARITVTADIFCDMPDQDGDDDGFLEDYFHVEYSTDMGATWVTMYYDYAREGIAAGFATWDEDDLFNGSSILTLPTETDFMLRFRMTTDDNDDGGDGTGLHVDNVVITTASVPLNDLAITKAWFDYPRVEGYTILPKVEISNLGAEQAVNVRANWTVYQDSVGGPVAHANSFAIFTAQTVDGLSSVRTEMLATNPALFQWVPSAPGNYVAVLYPNTSGVPGGWTEEDTSNDTLQVAITVQEDNVGFLRYDSGFSSGWSLAQDAAEATAYMVRFDPLELSVTGQADPDEYAYDGEFLNMHLYGMNADDEVTIVVHDEGADDMTIGPLLAQYTTTISGPDDLNPNIMNRYIGTFPNLKCRTTPVWIGVRANPNNDTGVVGLSEDNGGPYWEGHTYIYDYTDDSTSEFPGDLRFFIQIGWGTAADLPFDLVVNAETIYDPNATVSLSWNSPGPVDGYTIHRSTDAFFTPDGANQVADVDQFTTSYTDDASVAGSKYYYKVVGYNGVCPAID